MDERIQEMRLKLDKIAWEPDQIEKNKRAFAFVVVYADYLIQQAEKAWGAEHLLAGIWEQRNDFGETIKVLEKENKRYKEAIDEICNGESNLEGLDAERELERVTSIAWGAKGESE